MKPRQLAKTAIGLAGAIIAGVVLLGTGDPASHPAPLDPIVPTAVEPVDRSTSPSRPADVVALDEDAGVPFVPPPGVATTTLTEVPLSDNAARGDVREARIEFHPALREWGGDGDVPVFETHFRLFDGVERELLLDAQRDYDEDTSTFVGTVAGAPGSHVVLAQVGDAVAGTMYVPGSGLYRVRTKPGGALHLIEMNSGDLPEGEDVVIPPAANLPGPAGDALTPAADGNTVVDLMVAYTAQCVTYNGGTNGMLAVINAAIATTNLAYTNSQIPLTVRLVKTLQVTYTESGYLATDLPRITGTTDGYMDDVHAQRTANRADLVSLFVSGGTDAAGIAYLWTPSNTGFAGSAFSVVISAYADANITLAHELGHNMGAMHAAQDGGPGAYSYSLGYKFTAGGTAYRTVMAYAPGIRIPYFSNPNVNYLGVATGTAGANNALTLTNSRTTIAAFQTGLTASDQQWVPVTTGDFNSDGQTDVIWRNTVTGRVIVWYMNGTTLTSSAVVWSGDANWVPITAGDFNADGKTDLLWRYATTGRVIAWLMNGITTTSTANVWTGDANWVPITAGDFNADGKTDIIWRYATTGRVLVWYMNGTTMTSTAQVWNSDAAWAPIVAGDFNADGKPDLVWRNSTTGRVIVWLMNGITMTSSPVLWSGSAAWVPRTAGRMDAGSSPDLIWRSSSDGRVNVWLMSGTTMGSTQMIWQ